MWPENWARNRKYRRVRYVASSQVWQLDWHPLGHMICSGSNDHTAKFWCRTRPGTTNEELCAAPPAVHGRTRQFKTQSFIRFKEGETMREQISNVEKTISRHFARTSIVGSDILCPFRRYGGFIRTFTELDQLDKGGRAPAVVSATAAEAAVTASLGPRAAAEAARNEAKAVRELSIPSLGKLTQTADIYWSLSAPDSHSLSSSQQRSRHLISTGPSRRLTATHSPPPNKGHVT